MYGIWKGSELCFVILIQGGKEGLLFAKGGGESRGQEKGGF